MRAWLAGLVVPPLKRVVLPPLVVAVVLVRRGVLLIMALQAPAVMALVALRVWARLITALLVRVRVQAPAARVWAAGALCWAMLPRALVLLAVLPQALRVLVLRVALQAG